MAVILSKSGLSLSTKDFVYSKGSFVAEASDFNDVEFILSQRVYDDAIDTGFVLESETTGKRVRYVLHCKNYSPAPDRELLSTEYKPLPEDATDPSIAQTKVVIFND